MARVLITGSSDGLGRMAAEILIKQRHKVVLHARNEQRGRDAMSAVHGAETVLVADLSSVRQTKSLADQVNSLGFFDAVIHNAAVGYQTPRRITTEDGLSQEFAVNTLAPYILTALIHSEAEAPHLPELGSPQERRYKPTGSELGASPMERTAGLLRHKISRRAFGIRRCPPLAKCSLERARTGMGSDQDGRP